LNYSDRQKILFIYLITNGKCTESGIYKVSTRTISAILGWDGDETKKILSTLTPNAHYDQDSQCVFVKNFLKYNGMRHGRPDLIAKSIIKDRQNFETPLWDCFLRTYPKFAKSIVKGQRPFYEYDYDNDNESSSSSKPDSKDSPESKLHGRLKQVFESFIDWLIQNGKRPTNEGIKLMLKRLDELAGNDEGLAIKIIEQSLAGSWTSLQPIGGGDGKTGFNNSKGIGGGADFRNQAKPGKYAHL